MNIYGNVNIIFILFFPIFKQIGANFGLPLHQSMSEPYFESRQHIVTPYFFTRTGSVSGTTVKSASDTIIGTRRWYYYLPPSFKENTYKTYPTLFGFDQNVVYLESIKNMVEQATVDLGISEEVIIIGSEDYSVENVTENSGTNRGRLVLLTPSPAVEYFCTEGTYGDSCNGCVPPEASMETLGAQGGDFRIFYEYLKNGCGYPYVIGGHGDKYLDYMTKEVLPAINSLANNRLKTDSENVGLFGCSLGGLMSCHGAYTRPETFGFVSFLLICYSINQLLLINWLFLQGACQSASFWWPRQADLNLGFEFLNKTLKTMQGPRVPQKYYIDVTMDEVDPYYSQRDTHIAVFNQLKANSKQFKQDETLFFSLIYDQPHAIGACNSRIWEFIGHFSPASGAPNKPV